MSVVKEKSKCTILKFSSMLAIVMGIIMAFYAFYIMSELYSFSASDAGRELYTVIKFLNIAFMAVIAEGVCIRSRRDDPGCIDLCRKI